MKTSQINKGSLAKTSLIRLIPGVLIIGAMFFWPAGTFKYWQAWVYLAIIMIPTISLFVFLLLKDPEVLDRRIRTKEKEVKQKRIIGLSSIFLILAFLVPGFDKRWGWSDVPTSAVVIADVIVLVGYLLFFLVIRENRFASRVVEVEKEQQVISTGPYAVVRHPMYVGILLLVFFTPLALGSLWGMIPALMVFPVIVARILNEEEVLTRDLPGYAEYLQKTRYRLIPGIW